MTVGAGTLAVASLVASAAGTAATVVGGIQSANAQAAQASYQAQVAANNATIAQQNARASIIAGEAKAENVGLKNAATLGAVRAAEAANNVDVNSGSALDTQVTQRETGLQDVATTRHNAFMEAYGYQSQATGFQSQAQLDQAKAANATALEPLTAAGSLLSGASSLGTKWTKYQQSGALGGGASSNADDQS